MPKKCIHLEEIEKIMRELEIYWKESRLSDGRRVFCVRVKGGREEGHYGSVAETDPRISGVTGTINLEHCLNYLKKEVIHITEECNCESKNNQQLVLRRNVETDLSVVRRERNNLESRVSDLQSSNWSLQRENDRLGGLISAGERELTTKNNQIVEKDRQITTYSTQLTTAQNQLRDKEGQLTISKGEIKRVTELFNNLQIESNNKDNEIKTKEEKILSLKVKLGEAEEDILRRELISKERKLDELTRDLAIEPPQRVKELREAYERLIKAREDYSRDGVAAAQRDIDAKKQELLQTDIDVDNLYKVYRNCEKVAELRIKLEKIHEQRFEARQEQPTK